MNKGWIDSHNHLADSRLDLSRDRMISEAKDKGIDFFLQGGMGPQDWQKQKEIKKTYPEILLCFGLHPYWIAAHEQDECEKALDLLAHEISAPQILALGELGLDLRPHIAKDSLYRQIEYFELQLELADMIKKPMVLHIVQAFEEVKKIFHLRGIPSAGGMVHSFNGSVAQAEYFLAQGLHLSVGGALLRPENQKLHQAIAKIPMDFLLVETDSPDQPPPELKGHYNEPQTLLRVAEKLGDIKNLKTSEVLDRSSANLRKLLHL